MTNKLAITLSLAAIAALAACASPGGPHATRVVGSADASLVASTGVVTLPAPRLGVGKVALLTDPTGPLADISNQVAHLQMFDGTKQAIFVTGTQLTLGECISIRSDNSIGRRPQRDCG
jgi:hypothetical protein